jgi:hypothetical protein
MNNLSRGWQHIKGCHSKDDQHACNVVIPMVVIDSIHSIKQTSLFTSIHYRNFKRGMERKSCPKSHMDTSLWAFYDKANIKDYLSSDHYYILCLFAKG